MGVDAAGGSGSRPTLGTIARRASVSLATVSKVLNGRPGVSGPTRERVEHLLAASGYAQRDRPPEPGSLVELVVEDLASEWSIEIVRGVEQVAREHGYALSLSALGADHAVGEDWIAGVLHRRPVAVVLQFSALTAGRRDQLRARGIPFTVVDPVGDPPADVPVVGATNTAGGAAATQHLLDLGHRRIAAIAGPLDMRCAADRLAGHRAALAAAGREARTTSAGTAAVDDGAAGHVVVADFSRADGERAARVLLATAPRPTAIVTGNDLQALGVLDAARASGLRVPEDLSVVGFDDVAPARWARPALTTIRQPLQEMAQRATRMALRQHAGGATGPVGDVDDGPVRVELATSLVVRDSTAAPGPGTRDAPPVRR
ncbi:LacI family DNA-binding transcriptional regulator [Curtobacterium sp. MCPF17_046]|uniref:LacI family DNA-binding transcriptional regulator n=1 Tax=Curtobacterium sp. MCPF17_046 TaxID=2175663 RepID=UPI000D8262E3|nr:LacI family DNA-binding transcriptional regulator [Curtobacterium sp. MCPF17_046]PYY34055.1 LacI family transcriptional regulator [Curtobacterium sp. MCPF17_046]